MQKKLGKLFLLLILVCSLTACGFHLRGYAPLPPELHTLYLQSNSPYSALTKQLQQVLKSSGVILVQDSQDAPLTLQILSDNFGQQITGQGASGQISTYQLSYTVSYQLLDAKGRVVQPPQMVGTTRSYAINSNQILGDTTVQTGLKDDMRRDLIYQLLNRLRSRNTLKALEQH
jgi:LPS-assembly lipoprotein